MSAKLDARRKMRGVKLLYNPGEDRKSGSWRSDELETRYGRESQTLAEWALRPPIEQLQLERRCWNEERVPERLNPQAPRPPGLQLSNPGEWERNAVVAIRVGVNMLQFCSVSNSLSHATLSIKREVYFLKNCVAHLYCVVVMILHAHVDVYVLCVCIVSHGYTTIYS